MTHLRAVSCTIALWPQSAALAFIDDMVAYLLAPTRDRSYYTDRCTDRQAIKIPNASKTHFGKPASLKKDSFTYSIPFNAALMLTISRFSLAFSFFKRAVSSPCSLTLASSSSLSSLPLPLSALTILASSPLNRS